MKKTLLVSVVSAASTALALAAPATDSALPTAYPKNLARQHLGANLYQYVPDVKAYKPTQASAAWLDDDVTSGWAAMPGKQYYLLALPHAELITNFSLSARPTSGNISLYVGDEQAEPGAKSWNLVAKDVSLESVNEKKLAQPFSRVAKYLLIETDIADPGPIYSLYVSGEKPASAYSIHPRTAPIDVRGVFGAFVNESTTINVAGLHAHAVVKAADGSVDTVAQRAIDDNPETSVTLGGTGSAAELAVTLAASQSVSRIAVLVEPGAKGRLDFILSDGSAENSSAPATQSIILDGSSARASVDFTPTRASVVKARWTPAPGSDSVSLRELNAFAVGESIAANSIAIDAATTDETDSEGNRSRHDDKEMRDPKAIAEGKDDKAAPIAELAAGPYLPGALGFPPTPGFRAVARVGGPRTPKSP